MANEPDNFMDNLHSLAGLSWNAGAAPSPDDAALQRLLADSHALLSTASLLPTPDTLPPPPKEDSVDEARKILRRLRNLQGIDGEMESWLRLGALPQQQAKAEMLQRLVTIYAGQVKLASFANPKLSAHYLIATANHAAGSLAESVALHTLESLPPAHPHAAALDATLEHVPDEWAARASQPVERLIEAIETALSHLTSKPINDKAPADRLVELSDRIAKTARTLRSIDTLEAPAREESIELAREILRRLKNLGFSNKPMMESIDTGKPDEKLAFVQKIGELIESYKNLLFEAAGFNANILNDPRVKAANNAVGGLTHGIKLLAAKELPNSIAAAQQISADVSQMPDEWKDLCDRAVDRLLHSMEGGLERAVEDIMVEQQELQDQQQEQEAAQAAAAEVAHSSHARRRRRRRRHHSSSGGLTKSAARRNANDVNGDGVMDRLQNMDRLQGFGLLNLPDIAAVQQLGNSLRQISNEAARLAPPAPINVSPANPVAPDDKSFAERSRDQQTNPRNNNKPRIG